MPVPRCRPRRPPAWRDRRWRPGLPPRRRLAEAARSGVVGLVPDLPEELQARCLALARLTAAANRANPRPRRRARRVPPVPLGPIDARGGKCSTIRPVGRIAAAHGDQDREPVPAPAPWHDRGNVILAVPGHELPIATRCGHRRTRSLRRRRSRARPPHLLELHEELRKERLAMVAAGAPRLPGTGRPVAQRKGDGSKASGHRPAAPPSGRSPEPGFAEGEGAAAMREVAPARRLVMPRARPRRRAPSRSLRHRGGRRHFGSRRSSRRIADRTATRARCRRPR